VKLRIKKRGDTTIENIM